SFACSLNPACSSTQVPLVGVSVLTRTSLIATLLTAPSPDGKELTALPRSVEYIALPAELFDTLTPEWIGQHFHGRVLVEFDVEKDLTDARLSLIPPEQRIVSWRGSAGPAADLSDLQARFAKMSATPARFYKLVNTASSIREEFLPLSLLK